MTTKTPVQAARIAANQAIRLQRQQTAANRILARSDRQQARYAKSHPLYNYTSPTSVTDPTQIPAVDNSLNQPNQVVQGGGIDGSTLGTNATGGVTLGTTAMDSGSGNTAPTVSHTKWIIAGVAGLVGIALFIHFRK